MDEAEPCSFCDISIENSEAAQQPVSVNEVGAETDDEPEWRHEVVRRLAQYRARRGYRNPEEAGRDGRGCQTGLPFCKPLGGMQPAENTGHFRPRALARLRPIERMEITVQPELDFSAAAGERSHPQTALVPVATLAERRNGLVLDLAFILLTCLGFAGLFVGLMRSMGGDVVVDRADATVCVPVLVLFYALYFLVFTVFAGATPGMQFCGLTIVRLDGRLPDTRQLVWRGFGYVLSAATLMLGFLWAYWDEDGFSWQDRISQTYVTSAAPLEEPDPVEVRMERRAPLRK